MVSAKAGWLESAKMVFIALGTRCVYSLPSLPVDIPRPLPKGQSNLGCAASFFSGGRRPNQSKSSAGEQFFPKALVQERLLEKICLVRRRHDRFRLERQPEGKRRATPRLALRVNLAAVMMDDEKTGHQVDAVFGRRPALHDKRITDDPQCLLRQSRPVVADAQDDLRFRLLL